MAACRGAVDDRGIEGGVVNEMEQSEFSGFDGSNCVPLKTLSVRETISVRMRLCQMPDSEFQGETLDGLGFLLGLLRWRIRELVSDVLGVLRLLVRLVSLLASAGLRRLAPHQANHQ